MSKLENLPVEIFRAITSHLIFQDLKALSTTSKECYIRVGPLECPDQLSWITHLCRITPVTTTSYLLHHSKDVLDHVLQMYYRLIYDDFWDLDDTSHHPVTRDRYGRRPHDPDCPTEPLLLPYFDRPFPQSTLAYWYFELINEFAAKALDIIEMTILEEESMQNLREWEKEWWEIAHKSRLDLGWLARRKPVTRYQNSGKRRLRHTS
jgi:hypothetical protein